MLSPMRRSAIRMFGVCLLAIVAAVAPQGPALGATVLVDDEFHPAPPNTTDEYSVTIDAGWWNVVATRGSRFDYDLTLKNHSGQVVGSSVLGSYAIDWVAVNANDSCSGKASSNSGGSYTAIATPFGAAPASQGDNSPGYNVGRRGGGNVLSVLSAGAPDQFTTLVPETRWTRTDVWDVFLNAGTTYRVAWNRVHVYYEGALYLLNAASGGNNCIRTRGSTTPLLSHNIEVVADEFNTVRSGEVRFTAPTTGWYGLVLTQQTWDLQHVSLGPDNEPHVMIKVA
jgi:hypothetical protein